MVKNTFEKWKPNTIKKKSFLQNIHEFMTVPELGFYFGTSHRADVSEYQVVYLPALLQRASQTDEEGNPGVPEPVSYGFNAFGR